MEDYNEETRQDHNNDKHGKEADKTIAVTFKKGNKTTPTTMSLIHRKRMYLTCRRNLKLEDILS